MNIKETLNDIANNKRENLRKTRAAWAEIAILGQYDDENIGTHDLNNVSEKGINELKSRWKDYYDANFAYQVFRGYVGYNSQSDSFSDSDYIELENMVNNWKQGLPDQEDKIVVDGLISVDANQFKNLNPYESLEYLFFLYDQKFEVEENSYLDFAFACYDTFMKIKEAEKNVVMKK